MAHHNSKTTILRRRDVQLMIRLSRSTIYKMIAEGNFPRPIKLGARAVGWRKSDITDWLELRANGQIEP